MRFDDLRNFLELSRSHNVSHAADSLAMSQPALSRSLARLEAELGVLLFDRHGRRLSLNQYGEILVPHVARMATEFDHARARLDALKSPDAGVVSIAFVTSFGSWLVPQLVASYREIMPHVQFLLQGGAADSVLDAVRDGRADLGILSPEPSAPDVEWVLLAGEELVLALPPGGSGELVGLELVALKREFGLRQITDAYFVALGVAPVVVMEATELATVAALVGHGVGAAIMPRETAVRAGLAFVELAVPLSRPAGMIVQAPGFAGVMSPAAAQFVRFVREEMGDLQPGA